MKNKKKIIIILVAIFLALGIGVTIFVWIVGKLCGNCKRHKTREDYANKTVIKQIDKGTSNTQIGIQNNNYTGKRGSDE